MKSYDVIVVGCGAMGTSAAYNLSKRGYKVLALERFGLNHGLGSSHGKTRIIRLAYAEDSRYVPLLRRAFQAWKEIEQRTGQPLLMMTGGLMVGAPGGELVVGVLKSVREHQLSHRVLEGSQVGAEFPAFNVDEGLVAVHEDSAGVLFPEKCLSAFHRLAIEERCEFRFVDPVKSWTSLKEGIEVATSTEKYRADKVVMCAGPWMGGLTKGAVPLKVERQVPFWFDSKGEGRFSPDKMPIFVVEEGPEWTFYGFPDLGDGVKVGRHHGGETVDPDSVNRDVSDSDVSPVREFVKHRLPGLDADPVDASPCLYSNTPDSNFVIDFHPAEPRVLLVSACSGHGFKFAPVMGEVAADLIGARKPAFDISFLGLSRFIR